MLQRCRKLYGNACYVGYREHNRNYFHYYFIIIYYFFRVFTNADANPVCLASQFIRLVLSMSITAADQSQLRNQALEIYSERMALSSFMGHNNIISWFE